MIIQCEGCKKRLKIDDSKFVEDQLRCICPNCKRVIEVQKPKKSPQSPEPSTPFAGNKVASEDFRAMDPTIRIPDNSLDEDQNVKPDSVKRNQNPAGLTIGKKLLFLFVSFMLTAGGILTLVYINVVSSLVYEQINLRTYSISQSFSGAIQQPLLIKNYLLVNQTAASTVSLPGVAYVSVLNKRGIVIAGVLSDNELFDAKFRERVQGKGFPVEISSRNRIPIGLKKSTLDFSVGGQKIHDVAVMIGDTGGEAHIGMFTTDTQKAVKQYLIPFFAFFIAIVLIGSFCFYLVARTISTPIKALTQVAEKISRREMDLPIEINSGGEIGELAKSLERMRFSIKTAMDELRSK
ncbi:putative two domain sensory box histidine kinase (PAS/PAC domain/GGDEF domain protein) [Desulforapulum autotrophicum HRM2]|uniref:histidine kinase n=1 Tax=Desulforapulum autotrophicum (strain ATCC 43914 / DSM 3382 / VKM B-1955 / HRM2) TaxID=177437 RepID=C0QKF1_DESAH|nr:HAMP domain-containing protein [Desulforapulum autotrophicum]ACN14022.1 putative two domain sensory box histidine kinase (PAS/PAC domain/GGDEF domain protein) [Desulforapulum autotrophicum HRM2]